MADNDDESITMSNDTAAEDTNNIAQAQCATEVSLGEQSTVSLSNLGSPVTVSNLCVVAVDVAGETTNTDDSANFPPNAVEPSKQGNDSQVVTDGGADLNVVTCDSVKDENCETAVFTETQCAPGTELVNTAASIATIVYVQPDGTIAEGSGLTAEEKKQLVEQLAKQQLVQVSESEAARILKQSQTPKQVPVSSPQHLTASPVTVDLQQVIDHVNKTPQAVMRVQQSPVIYPKVVTRVVNDQPTSFITLDPSSLIGEAGQVSVAALPQPLTIVQQNASQRLASVAKHVALQQTTTSRLIQPKPVDTVPIQVQVAQKADGKEQTVTLLQSKPVTMSTLQGKVSAASVVGNAQILHITSLPGQPQQQLILPDPGPGKQPIQVLVRQPTQVVTSPTTTTTTLRPVIRIPVTTSSIASLAPKAIAGAGTALAGATVTPLQTTTKVAVAPLAPAPTVQTTPKLAPTSASPASKPDASPPSPEKEKKERRRERKQAIKPKKVQTRSGRVSRPPRHKARDYKFIKNEDLADSHQSDSDDYSEISEEDEEKQERKSVGGGGGGDSSFSIRSKAFKCETCDKAYIGLGGLSRHYRLNPTHGTAPPDPGTSGSTPARGNTSANTEDNTSPSNTPIKVGVGLDGARKAHLSDPPIKVGRSPGRPRKIQPPGVTKDQAQSRKDRLKAVLDQCDDEDLLDVVSPRLTKIMNVWEFILMKVENSRRSKPQFADVYREFEQLHVQVKKMAQHHPVGQPLEVHNMEVLRSLGITDRPSGGASHVSNPTSSPTSQEGRPTKTIRHLENTKMLPPAKRFKMENQRGEANGFQISQNGLQKTLAEAPVKKEEAGVQGVGPIAKAKDPPTPPTSTQPPMAPLTPPSTPAPASGQPRARPVTSPSKPTPSTSTPPPVKMDVSALDLSAGPEAPEPSAPPAGQIGSELMLQHVDAPGLTSSDEVSGLSSDDASGGGRAAAAVAAVDVVDQMQQLEQALSAGSTPPTATSQSEQAKQEVASTEEEVEKVEVLEGMLIQEEGKEGGMQQDSSSLQSESMVM